MTGPDLAGYVERARERVYRHACVTPLLPSYLGGRDRSAVLKLECLQVTGSFKIRGAANKLEALCAAGGTDGVVACSSGNHGRAVAYVARRLGLPAVIFVPRWADPTKLHGMRSDGADVRLEGDTYDAAEAAAVGFAADAQLPFISPFDDPEIIGGQGTIGIEILSQLEDVHTVLVPLSGGGLVAGIAAAIKQVHSKIRIVAVSAERARVMFESQRAGQPTSVAEEPTLAGALAGGIGSPNRYTFDAVRDLVDAHAVVTEEEIANAIRQLWTSHRLIVEGGGAVAAAAVITGSETVPRNNRTVVVISGGNIDVPFWCRLAGEERSDTS